MSLSGTHRDPDDHRHGFDPGQGLGPDHRASRPRSPTSTRLWPSCRPVRAKFSIQATFTQKLSDTLTAGIGNLVDANMAQESAQLAVAAGQAAAGRAGSVDRQPGAADHPVAVPVTAKPHFKGAIEEGGAQAPPLFFACARPRTIAARSASSVSTCYLGCTGVNQFFPDLLAFSRASFRQSGNICRTAPGKICRVRQILPGGGSRPANSAGTLFSVAAQNRCLSKSESGAARRLPIGLPGKTPNEHVRSIPERRDQCLLASTPMPAP